MRNLENTINNIFKNKKLKKAYFIFSILFIILFCINAFISNMYPYTWQNKLNSDEQNSRIEKKNDYAPPSNNQEIIFKDKHFEEVIKTVLKIEGKKIYNTDLEGIEKLDLNTLDIEYFPSLKILDLSRNHIKDLSGIDKLDNLEELNLYGNKIDDIKLLSAMSKLKTLDLANNNISDIDSLSNLYNLETVDLSFNKISNIEPLLNLRNLNTLDISKNNIKSKDDIKKLSFVKNLYDWGN